YPSYIFLLISSPHQSSPLFPYTTLFRSVGMKCSPWGGRQKAYSFSVAFNCASQVRRGEECQIAWPTASSTPQSSFPTRVAIPQPDRKSTRLNSSHVSISYAVFCLKKKTN